MTLKRSSTRMEPRCHWCHRDLPVNYRKTAPRFTKWGAGPAPVAVCGDGCPEKPSGAVVGDRIGAAE